MSCYFGVCQCPCPSLRRCYSLVIVYILCFVGGNNWWVWRVLSLCSRTCWIRIVKAFPCLQVGRFGFRFSFQFNGIISAGDTTNFSFIPLPRYDYHYISGWYPISFKCTILQKTNIIRDYLEDINEIPKSRMFWPREIWSKYVNKLEVIFLCLINTTSFFPYFFLLKMEGKHQGFH